LDQPAHTAQCRLILGTNAMSALFKVVGNFMLLPLMLMQLTTVKMAGSQWRPFMAVVSQAPFSWFKKFTSRYQKSVIAAQRPHKSTRGMPRMGSVSSLPARAIAGQTSPLAGQRATCSPTGNVSFRNERTSVPKGRQRQVLVAAVVQDPNLSDCNQSEPVIRTQTA